MSILFQDELITRILLNKINKEIKEEELEKTIEQIDSLNKIRRNVVAKCNAAFSQNNKYGI